MNKSLLVGSVLIAACSRGAPAAEASREPVTAPTSSATASAASPEIARNPAPSASVTPSAPSSNTLPEASASAAPQATTAAETAFVAPPLRDAAGQLLPQTEDKPKTDSAFFQTGARRLFEAIVLDDAERALPFFFPVLAYEQVKDVKNPARDWEYRLVAAFRRQLHEYHGALGRTRDQTKFLRLEVPEARAEWMKPGSEGNRLGYFRVLRSRLVYADADGKERSLEVTSLISWRGEWYLVHLHGFE